MSGQLTASVIYDALRRLSAEDAITMPKSDFHGSIDRPSPRDPRQSRDHARRPRIETSIQRAILAAAFEHPGRGQDQVARELARLGIRVSASGVRYVWQRHGIETISKRVQFIERRLGEAGTGWTDEQRATRNRVHAIKQMREAAAGISLSRADGLSRSSFIVTVAARLLRESSYDATSLRDIAKAAGIPVGSLYYHFQTKEDLFAAVYAEGIRRLTTAVQQAVDRFSDPWQRLEAASAAHLQELCTGDDFTSSAIQTELPRLNDATRNTLTQLSDSYEMILRDLVAQLPTSPRASRSLIRLQLLGALNWTRVWFKPNKSSPRDIGRQFVRTLRYGLEQNRKQSRRTVGRFQ
jgi:TetR/AcrR family transcriptional regulator, cholesterol catabolism regulator